MSSENANAGENLSPADPEETAASLSSDAEPTEEEIAERRAGLREVIEMLRPMVQMDGGDLEVVEVDYVNGVVEVELQGACGSCAVSATTLSSGVDRILKERLSWVTEVVGGVDEEIDELESASLGRGAYVPKYY